MDLGIDLLGSGLVQSFNDRLLTRLGGSLLCPPLLRSRWEEDPCLDEFKKEALELYARAPQSGIESLWNDARLGLTLPFWKAVLDRPIVGILRVGEPLEVASTLTKRHGIALVRALATYERYFHIASQSLEGIPVFIDVDGANDDGVRRSDLSELRQFLTDIDIAPETMSAVLMTCDPTSQDETRGDGAQHGIDDDLIFGTLAELHRGLRKCRGSHVAFAAPALGEESAWTSALLASESDIIRVFTALDWATKQIEPLIRVTPRNQVVNKESAGQDIADDDPDGTDSHGSAPYPQNASEDRHAYHRWLRARRQPIVVDGLDSPPRRKARTRAPLFRRHDPLVSIIVPIWRTPRWALERCVGSVLAQTARDWELCLCDDASGDADLSAYLKSLRHIDRRIKIVELKVNGGISVASNAAIAIARGRFVAFLDHDDELAPCALEDVERAIMAAPDVDVLYSDEDKIDATGERFDPLFKPEWSPDLLLSFAYICHLTVIRRTLLNELGGLRSEFDGSQDYDLSIRATERARRIVHIPEVLYHWRTLPGSAASDTPGAIAKPWAYAAGRRAIEDALERRGEAAEVTEVPGYPGRYHVRRKVQSHPLVSVIIPFRDEPALLATCMTSLRIDPGYDRIEFVLVDNGSELPETAALLDRLSSDQQVKVVTVPGAFNWAGINNAAVRQAEGEILLFMNNDIEARSPRWLDALLGHALRPEVGAVGARLLYPDGAIQHAGVVIGLGGIAGHPLRGLSSRLPGYNSMAIQTRNCSVVTGACMMTRRDAFDEVGGFNEFLPVAYNDVDFCLKLRERNYLVVYTPLAELVHHESRSRGHTDDLVESRRILSRWADVIAAGDPYLSKHLSHYRHWCPLSTAQEDYRWKNYLEMSVLTRASSSSTSGR
jgi:GT2 family glycosyltransferase